LILLEGIEKTTFPPKIGLKRGHVKLKIDDRQSSGTLHEKLAEAAGFPVPSSELLKFRKSLSDQRFVVFDRGNFGLNIEMAQTAGVTMTHGTMCQHQLVASAHASMPG
jgi:hypothetical protein